MSDRKSNIEEDDPTTHLSTSNNKEKTLRGSEINYTQ